MLYSTYRLILIYRLQKKITVDFIGDMYDGFFTNSQYLALQVMVWLSDNFLQVTFHNHMNNESTYFMSLVILFIVHFPCNSLFIPQIVKMRFSLT